MMTIEDILNENGCSLSVAGPIEMRMAQVIADLREELVYQQSHACRPFRNKKIEWRRSQASVQPPRDPNCGPYDMGAGV